MLVIIGMISLSSCGALVETVGAAAALTEKVERTINDIYYDVQRVKKSVENLCPADTLPEDSADNLPEDHEEKPDA